MERIYKIARNINLLKIKYGLNPVKVEGVKPKECFDYVFTKYDANDIIAIQDKLKKEIETEAIEGIEANKLAFYAAVHATIEPYRKGFLESFNTSNWQRPECPFCGRKAGLSQIGENGKRRLICHFCWTEWEYPRIKCFNCEKEASEYALFEVDRHEIRVDYCNSCKNYVKTVFFEFSDEPYVIWDLKTLSLDDWAISKGYKKPTPSLVGIDFTK
ncbi:MAG: hypothetical protein OHK0040_06540 [bacterium]